MDLEIYDETKTVPQAKLDMVADLIEFAGNFIKLPSETEMSVTLMDNEAIHQINKEYRG